MAAILLEEEMLTLERAIEIVTYHQERNTPRTAHTGCARRKYPEGADGSVNYESLVVVLGSMTSTNPNEQVLCGKAIAAGVLTSA